MLLDLTSCLAQSSNKGLIPLHFHQFIKISEKIEIFPPKNYREYELRTNPFFCPRTNYRLPPGLRFSFTEKNKDSIGFFSCLLNSLGYFDCASAPTNGSNLSPSLFGKEIIFWVPFNSRPKLFHYFVFFLYTD